MRFLPFLLVFISHCLSAQVWSRVTGFPGSKRDDGVAVVVGNTAYFGTGLQEGWSATIDWHALDLTTLAWTSVPDMPHTTERQYACAFAGTGCFFVFGGAGVGGALNNLYRFDIATSTWSLMAAKPGAGLIAASCLPFGDRVIIAGGRLQAAGSINHEVWEYNITNNTWRQKNDLPFDGRWRASSAVLHNYGYLLFGIDTFNVFRKELYRYDRNGDTWTKVSDFPGSGRAYAAMQGVSEKLFVFGGYDSSNTYFNDVWYYNDIVNTWSQGPALPSFGRKGGMSCAANGNFYYSCGIRKGDERLNETWMTDVPLGLRVASPSARTRFILAPHPARSFVKIAVGTSEDFSIVLSDLAGQVLENLSEQAGPEIELDLSKILPGIYALTICGETGYCETMKLVRASD